MNSLASRIAARFLSAAVPPVQEDVEPLSPGDQAKYMSLPGQTTYETWFDTNKVLKKPQWRTMTQTMELKLRRGLGLGPKSPAWQFFALADHVLHMSMGAPRENLATEFKTAGNKLARVVLDKFGDVVGADVAGAIQNFLAENRSNLIRISSPQVNGMPFTSIGAGVSQVIEKLAKAMDVAAGTMVKPMGSGRWPQIRVLTKKEEDLRDLQENNPELYEQIMDRAKALTPGEQLQQTGMVPTTLSIEGVPVPAGMDPLTGEKFLFPTEQPPVAAGSSTFLDPKTISAQGKLESLREETAAYHEFIKNYEAKVKDGKNTPEDDATALAKDKENQDRARKEQLLVDFLNTSRRPINVLSEQDYRRDRAAMKRRKGYLLTDFAPMTTFVPKRDDKGNIVKDKDGKPEMVAAPVRNPDALVIDGARRFDPSDFVAGWNDEAVPGAEAQPEGEGGKAKKPPKKTWDDALKDVRIFPATTKKGTPNDVQYRALTDNKAEIEGTRIYAVREDINGELVIIEGRFRGFYLDDMVNAAGRLVEGAAYDLDGEGNPVEFTTLGDDGKLSLDAVNKEPYCTLDSQGRFLIKIPMVRGAGGKDPYREARARMAAKASRKPFGKSDKDGKPKMDDKGRREMDPGWIRGSIWELPMPRGEGRTMFTFEAKDFATVRAAVGGFCMSSAAAEALRKYNAQLARQEAAVKKDNLAPYDLFKIGGFRFQRDIDPQTGELIDTPEPIKELMSKQKEALSWIESKGYSGLAALDTGVGKTLLTIATMQKMTRDGAAGDKPFLYVCPKLLLNNFVSEMKSWLTDEAYADLKPRVKHMSYEDFAFEVLGGERNMTAPKPGSGAKRKKIGPDNKPERDEHGRIKYEEDVSTRKTMPVRERVPELDKDGKVIPILDGNGGFVPERDEKGNIVLDGEGNPKPRIKYVQLLGPDGAPKFTKDGEPVYKTRIQKETKGMNLAFGDQFAAIFFDEAHYLTEKGENSDVSRAAQLINHPRKILLTASPMDDDPDALYTSVAITHNQIVAGGWDRDPATGQAVPVRGSQLSQARKELMAFRRRFCVRAGGRTLGIKSDSEADPTARQDFDAWAKDGMYFADKTTIGVEGTSAYEQTLRLPQKLPTETVCLNMHPDIEEAYRATAAEVANILKALVKVFTMNINDLRSPGGKGKAKLTEAEKALTTNYEAKLKKHIKLMEQLVNYPEDVKNPDGTPRFEHILSNDPTVILSPKIQQALAIVRENMGKKRVVMFTDDPRMAKKTGQALANNLCGCRVAVGLKDRITVYEARPAEAQGQTAKTGSVRIAAKVHRPEVYTNQMSYEDKSGGKIRPEEWASHVLAEKISPDPTIRVLVLSKEYALGQNLQAFGAVVHLDRDTFSNEIMKQRLARVWRTKQKSQVEEYVLDVTYSAPGKDDYTLDQVRGFIQSSQENLFNDIVMKSRMATIGEDWDAMKETNASLMEVNNQLMELMFAPYPEAVADFKLQQAVLDQRAKGPANQLPPVVLPPRYHQ